MSIILLRGFSNSGKDYVGKLLCDNHNYKRFAFADSLKIMVAKNFGCNVELLHSQEVKLRVCELDSFNRTYRQILIDEALRLRNLDSGIFAKHCCNEINEMKQALKIVITDWRYPNELEILKEYFPNHKIIPVHIKRSGQNESLIEDISEYQLINRTNDFIINNYMNDIINNEIQSLINHINSQ